MPLRLSLFVLMLLGAAEASAFNTFTNIAIKTDDRDKVIQTLRDLKRRAYVSPLTAGYIVVFDAGTERMPNTLPELVVTLSERLKCATIGVYDHNDSLLILVTAKDGQKVDHYASNPGYFEGKRDPPVGGDSSKIQAALGLQNENKRLQELLTSQSYDIEYERHNEIIKVLGLPDYCSAAGHAYFRADTLPWKYDRSKWEIIGQP